MPLDFDPDANDGEHAAKRWLASSTHHPMWSGAGRTEPHAPQPDAQAARHNEELIERFRDWLAKTRDEIDTLPDSADSTDPRPVGLLELTEALTAMRHELKLETKSSRGLAESLKAALAGLDDAIDQFRSVEPRETEAADRSMRPLVESLIALDEALQRGLNAIETTWCQTAEEGTSDMLAALDLRLEQMPAWRRWWVRGWHAEVKELCRQRVVKVHSEVFEVLLEGYRLICSRLERELSEHQIRRIDCVGRPFNPAQMTVVGLVNAPQTEPETVVEEVRPGYLWREKVVRFAEVRVARRESSRLQVEETPKLA